jgi:hypothetical protein
MRALWDIAPFSLGVDRRFRGATAWCYIPEGSDLHTRRLENLKSHKVIFQSIPLVTSHLRVNSQKYVTIHPRQEVVIVSVCMLTSGITEMTNTKTESLKNHCPHGCNFIQQQKQPSRSQ